MSSQKEKRKRSRNTNSEQYEYYLQFMESDYAFRSGTINPTLEENYLEKKWIELCTKLNAIGDGPNLTVEEWKKRFVDWKYATRSKYRKLDNYRKKTGSGPQSDIKLTNLEERGLAVWGKVAVTGTPFILDFDGLTPTLPLPEHIDFMEDIPIHFEVEAKVQETPTANKEHTDTVADDVSTHEEVSPRYNSNILKTPKRQSLRKKVIKPQPLTELAQKLILSNDLNNESVAELNSTIKMFFVEYIKNEQENRQLKREKLLFKIAKYKHQNKDFDFNLK